MNERLKHMGYYSAAEFNRNVTRWIESRRPRAVTIEEW
jgi:HPr kinase/phosphorylase